MQNTGLHFVFYIWSWKYHENVIYPIFMKKLFSENVDVFLIYENLSYWICLFSSKILGSMGVSLKREIQIGRVPISLVLINAN